MTPAFNLASQWQTQHDKTGLETLLARYFACGLVYSTADTFMLAHECHYNEETGEVTQGVSTPNAWFVRLASSTLAKPLKEFARIIPRKHAWALWCRRNDNRLRAHRLDKLVSKGG